MSAPYADATSGAKTSAAALTLAAAKKAHPANRLARNHNSWFDNVRAVRIPYHRFGGTTFKMRGTLNNAMTTQAARRRVVALTYPRGG
jgi:hypothetical protein